MPQPTLTHPKRNYGSWSLSFLGDCFSIFVSLSPPHPPHSCQTPLQGFLTYFCSPAPAFADNVSLCFESPSLSGLLPLVLQLPNLWLSPSLSLRFCYSCPKARPNSDILQGKDPLQFIMISLDPPMTFGIAVGGASR